MLLFSPRPNRYASVRADGKYVTDIANDGARFSVMVAALIGARISLSIGAVAAMKVCLIGRKEAVLKCVTRGLGWSGGVP